MARKRDMGTLAAAAAEEEGGLGRIEGEVGDVQDSVDGGNIIKSVAPPPPPLPPQASTTTITKDESPKAKKGYMYRPTNYEIGRAIETPRVVVQELSSATEEGGAEQRRVRNKFHAWHLRKLLWRKESERRLNMRKGRGKKKKRQMGG